MTLTYDDMALNYKDIILRHGYGVLKSRKDADISVKLGNKIFSTPVCIANMPSIQTYDILKTLDSNHWPYVYHRFGDTLGFLRRVNEENWYSKSISIGIKDSDFELLKRIKKENLELDILTLDVAFCYAEHVIPMIQFARKLFPETYFVVGNAGEPHAVKWLQDMGVNCLKLGIGNSKNCRTRQYSGFGSTTVTSLIECVARADSIDICADGGLTMDNDDVWIGDCAKAIGLGSKFVMSASLFKQIKELEDESGNITCSGNASLMIKQSEDHVEGVTLKFKGHGRTLEQQMKRISDSLKSSLSYSGFKSLDEMRSNICFYTISGQ